MTNNARYDGKPLLRLLELYVLKIIGELASADEIKLIQMTPKLRQIYNHGGDWENIIASIVNFSDAAMLETKKMWIHNKGIAINNGVKLSAQEFAEMYVDENFDI